MHKPENKGKLKSIEGALTKDWNNQESRRPSHPYIGLRELRPKSLVHAFSEVETAVTSATYISDDLREEDIECVMRRLENKNGFIRKSFKGIRKDWQVLFSSPANIRHICEYAEMLKYALN